MIAMMRWRVEVFLGERDRQTYAEARLHTQLGDHLPGVGRARPNPNDHDVPEIGDETAGAEVLTDPGHRLLLNAGSTTTTKRRWLGITLPLVRLRRPVPGAVPAAGYQDSGSRSAAHPTRTSCARSYLGWIRP